MNNKIKIRVKKPWIAYPGTPSQQNYAEGLVHGYLQWDIKSTDEFDVKFCELKNPKPYVTLDWLGDVESTLKDVVLLPGSRVRIRSNSLLSHKQTINISDTLRHRFSASEVVFKSDDNVSREVITAGDINIVREDLRSLEALLDLLKQFYKNEQVDDAEWECVSEYVKNYLSSVITDDSARNTKWCLKRLKFDNVLSYGEDNVINFDKLHGITGIFGLNRVGKSSIVGAMMYALFNTTDRGSIKNIHVVNTRKQHCYAQAVINVNNVDYVIERQTALRDTKKGPTIAITSLNAYLIDENCNAIDLVGEQRSDTEKVIRKLIGTSEDLMLTSVSSQDGDQFIKLGSSRRQQYLSKFLDLDVMQKIHELSKNDFNAIKLSLKSLPDKDWAQLISEAESELTSLKSDMRDHEAELISVNDELTQLRDEIAKHTKVPVVTRSQIESQRSLIETMTEDVEKKTTRLRNLTLSIEELEGKIEKIEDLKSENDLSDLKNQLEKIKDVESSVTSLKHIYEREKSALDQIKRSLKILDDVPCGDAFPTCRFIKDAHENKSRLEEQENEVNTSLKKLSDVKSTLQDLKKEELVQKISKIEKLADLRSTLIVSISGKKVEQVKLESELIVVQSKLATAVTRLSELETAMSTGANVEILTIKNKIDELSSRAISIDAIKLKTASRMGRIKAEIEKHSAERDLRESLLKKMRAHELIFSAFSKKGIPNKIITSQLPIINAEILKILSGIVDFTIELEADEDTDAIEIYINYNDSRRLIELCSGMEKTIASIALRVALVNITALPRSDVFIIDEGFGTLDPNEVESCCRLLESLKAYFKNVIVITHVPAIKDAADQVIEIVKIDKDSKVVST